MLISTMISEVRRATGSPSEQELGDDSIIMEIWGVVSLRRTQLKLTNESWQVSKAILDVHAGSPTELPLPIGDFGQAFLIRTMDDFNPHHLGRTIDIVKPEQMSMYWGGPDNLELSGSLYSPHVAMAFAPYNENGQWKIMWKPAHLIAARYTMWYTPGAAIVPPIYDDMSNFPIEEQNFFIIADVSLNLFPNLADEETGYNERQKLLVEVQEKKYQQWGPVFEAQRWEGPRREPAMHRKFFGTRRSGTAGPNLR